MGYKVGPLRREFAMEPGASEHPIVDDRAPRDAQARGGFIEFQATHEAQPRHARCTRCKGIEPVEGIDDGRAQIRGGRAGEVEHTEKPFTQSVPASAITEDGERVVVGSADGSLVIFESRTLREVLRVRCAPSPIAQLWLELDGIHAIDRDGWHRVR